MRLELERRSVPNIASDVAYANPLEVIHPNTPKQDRFCARLSDFYKISQLGRCKIVPNGVETSLAVGSVASAKRHVS